MSLIDFDSTNPAPVNPPRNKQQDLRERFFAAWRRTPEYAEHERQWQANAVHGWGEPRTTPSALFNAASEYQQFLEHRLQHLERTIRTFVDSSTDQAQRTTLLAAVYGKQMAGSRDKALLSKAERRLLNHYTRMDPAARQMVRTLFERLADTSDDNDEDGGA
jgi:hypothetical protein